MAEKHIIAITGATGAQGGGLVRAILADRSGEFTPRAITRKGNSDKADALRDGGAEVVTADLDDLESLKKALRGAHGAFFVTNFWEHLSPEKEISQARNMAEAAKAAGIRHAVWSTLDDTRILVPLADNRMPTLHGKYKVPHFDAKGEANRFFAEYGVPTTFLNTTFYWENFISFGSGPKKGPDGAYAITLPMGDKKLAGIASQDIGKCAYGVFQRGATLIGKTVGIAGDHLPVAAMASALTKALGVEIRYNDVPPEVFRAFGFPAADEVGNMFQYYRDFAAHYCASHPVAFSRSLNPDLLSFDAWLALNASRIPLE